MGTIYKNGIEYGVGNFMAVRNLTQAEYNALTTAEKNDGTIYFINDGIPTLRQEVDYVVAQGTDGIWDYRKWASGIYELWGSYEATGLVLTTASQNTYYGTNKTIDLPSFSIACDYVLATESRTVHEMGSGVYVFCTQCSATNIRLEFRSHASQSSAVAGVQIYARGRWK